MNLDSELFTDLGSFTSDEQYVRAVEYYNDKIYAGIGANAMLIEYDINTGIKRNILPPEYSTDSFVYDLFRIEDKLIIGLEPSNKILLYDLKLQGFKLLMEDAVANPGISAISDLPSNYYFRGFGDYIYEFNKKTSEINRLLPAESSMPITGAEIISDEYIAGITRDANYLEIYPDGLVRNYINLGNVGLEPINVNPTDFVANNGILYLVERQLRVFDTRNNSEKYFYLNGESKAMCFSGGNLLSAHYPGAILWMFPEYLFDNSNEFYFTNKKFIALDIEEEQNRPMTINCHSNFVLIGTQPNYGQYGGGLTVFVDNGKTFTLRNIVPNHTILSIDSYIDNLTGSHFAFLGTSAIGGTGTSVLPEDAHIVKYDLDQKAIVFDTIPQINNDFPENTRS